MDMQNNTLITLCWELYEQGIPKSHIAKKLNKNRETIHIWINNVQKHGLLSYLDIYEHAKKGERKQRQVSPITKRLVWKIREREFSCCGQKIQYFLQNEYCIHLSVPKIYEILKEKYIIRSKWKKNKERGFVPRASMPRHVIQMDTIDFGDIFAFTAIDTYTREADIFLAPELTARYGSQFLTQSMNRRFSGHVHLIQTDGGPEFKADFLKHVLTFCDRHRIAKPYRKNEQAYIESFNRTVRKECLGWSKYKADQLQECQEMVESFLRRYHYHRPHMSLNMQPPLLDEKEVDCRIFTEN